MRSVKLNSKGQSLTLDQFPNILITLFLIGIVGSIVILLQSEVQESTNTVDTCYSWNNQTDGTSNCTGNYVNDSITYSIESVSELTSWTPTIALILAVVFILGVIALIAIGRRQSV